ncbi:hypothetical protein NL676_008220 [Syzygium grande]|nr:hypothetical protein NL676_008220 [Syzygium grande]
MPLAKIGGDNLLWMHKLLKRLSGTIAKEEFPERHGRLYIHDTDLKVINRNEGMEEVEVLCFDFKNRRPHTFTETNFKSMPNIRFLKLDHASMTGNFANVFPKLRWLRWQGCPRDFEATEFNLTELVILDLSWSKVTQDWGGWELIKMEQLKVLNLTGCTDLLISPEFSSFPNLEILILERCSRLVHLHPSVGGLKNLLCLNLKSCTELNMLPAELGGLEALKELLIDETSVRDIPWEVICLEEIHASSCRNLEGEIPGDIRNLIRLRILRLRDSAISRLPPEIEHLSKLETLDILHCDMLHELPALPSGLVIVHLSPKLKEKVSNLLGKHCFITV